MPEDGRGQPDVVVDVGECRCPGTPHASDWVALAPRLTVPAGAATLQAMKDAEADNAAVEAALVRSFLRFGIVRWSFTDEAGDPIPVDYAAIARLLDWATALQVAERCNELYAEDFFRPLVMRMSTPSPLTPMVVSTSPTNGSGSKHRKHSKRSSLPVTASRPSEDPVP